MAFDPVNYEGQDRIAHIEKYVASHDSAIATLQAGGTGTSGAVTKSVSQTAHGFTVGQVIRYNGTAWVLSKADAAANADVDAIVSAVTDANTFTALFAGDVTGMSGLTAGQDYFLDPSTAGNLTTTEPSTAGQVSVPVVKAISTTESIFRPLRGLVIPTAAVTVVPFQITDQSTAITTGEGKAKFTVPSWLNGKKLVAPSGSTPGIYATASVAPTGTGLSVGIRKGAATEMLSTNITIDINKVSSGSSATAPVVNGANATVATDDVISIDVDQADSNTIDRGVIVQLVFQ